MKLLVISLCTTGIMRELFVFYSQKFAEKCELYCITNDNVSHEETRAKECLNVRYKRKNPLGYFSPKKLGEIKRFIKKVQPDCVLFFTPHPLNILLSRFVGKHFFYAVQIHDPVPHLGLGRLDRIIRLMQIRRHKKRADLVFVAGEALKKQLVEVYGFDEGKIRPVFLATVDNFTEHPRTYDGPMTIDALFFGRIEEYKGIDILSEAAKLTEKKYRIKVDGRGDKSFEERVSKEYIDWANVFVSDEDMIRDIQQSKLVVLPYKEASGSMTLGIAFYFGKPVIATRVGVFPEYIGNAGVLVEPCDEKGLAKAMDDLLGNPELLAELSENAMKRFSVFEIERATDAYIKLIEEGVHA